MVVEIADNDIQLTFGGEYIRLSTATGHINCRKHRQQDESAVTVFIRGRHGVRTLVLWLVSASQDYQFP